MNAQIKKSDTAKMSHSGKVAKKSKSKRAKFLRAVLWVSFVLAALIGIATAYIWHNRMGLMETQIRRLMAKQGYELALDIQKLSKNQAVVTDIVMGREGEIFLKADRMVVDYDINKRMAQRIELVRPYINVKFDTSGNILSGWMPQGSGGGEQVLLPPNGLVIDQAVVDWQLMQDANTMLGEGQVSITADIKTDTNWNANISGQQNRLIADNISGDFEHDIFIETRDGKSFDIFGTMDVNKLRTELLLSDGFKAENLNSQFNLNYSLADAIEKTVLSGWYHARIKDLSLADYGIAAADIKVNDMTRRGDGQVSANWQLSAKAARISNDIMRKGLADKLSSHSALAQTPIARYFTGTLYDKTERLLNGFDLDGQGTYKSGASGYNIDLAEPLRLTADGQALIVTNSINSLVAYDRDATQIQMRSDISWLGAQALQLTNFNMEAFSENGTGLDAIQKINAQITSKQQWRLQSEGKDVRLAPFDIAFNYSDTGNNIRTVNIDGGIDYDGPVPGGLVQGLKADGVMDLRLHGDDFTLGYFPSGPLSIAAFTNPSGWTTKTLNFILVPEDKLLSRTATSGIMRTTLRNVSTQIIDPEDTRHLDARFERLDVSTDFAESPQHWQVKVGGTDIKSEDFPAPGTHIVTPGAMLHVYQTKAGDITFDILSPETRVVTDNAKIENLHIGLSGSPDDIALEYNAGSVAMVGGAVPVLPMYGTARLRAGELTGHAITDLPKTKDTPIDIHYRSKDGQGSAKILIPKIIFDPYGLQPQQLIPVLRGKLADVSGEASAEFDFVFGDGQPVQSSGWADLKGVNVGTLVGPISGVNSKLTFTSIFPLKTDGVQMATLSGFDPGFPLNDGRIQFEIIPGGVLIHQALWPIENIDGASGEISLTPTDWRFGDVENRVVVNVENVGLGTMLASIGRDKLSATGQVYGTLPARIKGVDVLIEDGLLAVKDGGIIRYKSAATDAAAARDENAGHAFKALENFHYKQLEARIDGPIDGEMALKIVFDGQNPEVLSGQTFQFNTVVTGELANIARNMTGAFSNEENLSRIMEIKNGKTTDTLGSD